MSDYLAALVAHFQKAPLEGGVTHVEVRHDDWCRVFKGRRCNCNPTIVTGKSIQEKYEGDAK